MSGQGAGQKAWLAHPGFVLQSLLTRQCSMSDKSVTREAVKIISLCIAWYTFSATNNVLGKKIFMVFPYPMTLSMTHHLAMNALLGPALALLSVKPSPYISTRFYVRRLVPLAMGKVLASFTSMVSILKVPVSYAHTGRETQLAVYDGNVHWMLGKLLCWGQASSSQIFFFFSIPCNLSPISSP